MDSRKMRLVVPRRSPGVRDLGLSPRNLEPPISALLASAERSLSSSGMTAPENAVLAITGLAFGASQLHRWYYSTQSSDLRALYCFVTCTTRCNRHGIRLGMIPLGQGKLWKHSRRLGRIIRIWLERKADEVSHEAQLL